MHDVNDSARRGQPCLLEFGAVINAPHRTIARGCWVVGNHVPGRAKADDGQQIAGCGAEQNARQLVRLERQEATSGMPALMNCSASYSERNCVTSVSKPKCAPYALLNGQLPVPW